MGRSIEISGNSIVYLLYAVSLAIVPVFTYFVIWPPDDVFGVLLLVPPTVLVLVVAADLWYWRSGGTSEHLHAAAKRNLPYDITYDPTADPGQAAKQQWLKAVRSLPGGDNREEEDEERRKET